MKACGGIEAGRNSTVRGLLAGLLIAAWLQPGILGAWEWKAGNTLIMSLKDGQTTKGELLTVKGDRLILLDSDTRADADIWIGDIARIKVIKKSGFLIGAGVGLLAGAVTGMVVGSSDYDNSKFHFGSRKDNERAGAVVFGVLGALLGGVMGAAAGADESMDVGSMPPGKLDKALKRLKKFARIID